MNADGKQVKGMTMTAIKKKRFLAAAAVLVLALFMLFNLCFLVAESGHDCIGEDCPICCRISLCEELIKTVYHGFTAVFAAFLLGLPVPGISGTLRKTNYRASLVTWKVKLSD